MLEKTAKQSIKLIKVLRNSRVLEINYILAQKLERNLSGKSLELFVTCGTVFPVF